MLPKYYQANGKKKVFNENNLGFGFNRWEGFGENINDDLNNYAVKFNKDEMTMKKKKNVTPFSVVYLSTLLH